MQMEVGGALENILNDPMTLDDDETYNENLIPWCFLYGEKDWISPYTISEPGRPDRLASFEDYKADAAGVSDLMKGCTL
jgi:hypothetical protein